MSRRASFFVSNLKDFFVHMDYCVRIKDRAKIERRSLCITHPSLYKFSGKQDLQEIIRRKNSSNTQLIKINKTSAK